jgi:hypothetical protein
MNFNSLNLGNLFSRIDSDVEGIFSLEGKDFELYQFKTQFFQEVDHKGQPQHETHGGQLFIALSQSVPDNIYDWAKRANKRKNGNIKFKTKTSGTVLDIAFFNADCVQLERTISSTSGTRTTLLISPEKVSFNGIMHDNKWGEE